MSQQKKDTAEVIVKNWSLIKNSFGGTTALDTVMYIDLKHAPDITPQCIYFQVEQQLYNGQNTLQPNQIDIIKTGLLQQWRDPKSGKDIIKLSRGDKGKYNVVLFEQHQPQDQQKLELRSQTLFLLDLHISQLQNNKPVLNNLLQNICKCAYDFSAQNPNDMNQQCKLYMILKHGKEVGAIQTLNVDFLSDPDQRLSFLQMINTNLDPIYMQQYPQSSWVQSCPVPLGDVMRKLQSITNDYRHQIMKDLHQHVSDDNLTVQQINETFNIDSRIILQNQFIQDKLDGIGNYYDNMSEVLNTFIIFNLPHQSDYMHKYDLFVNKKLDKKQILEAFASS